MNGTRGFGNGEEDKRDEWLRTGQMGFVSVERLTAGTGILKREKVAGAKRDKGDEEERD